MKLDTIRAVLLQSRFHDRKLDNLYLPESLSRSCNVVHITMTRRDSAAAAESEEI